MAKRAKFLTFLKIWFDAASQREIQLLLESGMQTYQHSLELFAINRMYAIRADDRAANVIHPGRYIVIAEMQFSYFNP